MNATPFPCFVHQMQEPMSPLAKADTTQEGRYEMDSDFALIDDAVPRRPVGGFARLAQKTLAQLRSTIPGEGTPSTQKPVSSLQARPSFLPAARGIAFSNDAAVDLRVRLRAVLFATAQVVHAGFRSQSGTSLLIDHDNRDTCLTIADVRGQAEELHAEARAQLMDAYLNATEQTRLDRILRAVNDLLCALRGAESATTCFRLLAMQDAPLTESANATGERYLAKTANHADNLVTQTAQALSRTSDPDASREAATGVRHVRQSFTTTYAVLRRVRDLQGRRFPLTPSAVRLRLALAALYGVLICAESIARIAARFAVSVAEQAASDASVPLQRSNGDDTPPSPPTQNDRTGFFHSGLHGRGL